MNDRIDHTQATYLRRSTTFVVGAFSSASFLLSAIGLYGVIAFSVNQRAREIGVRMALGAQRSAVYRMILSEALLLASAGVSVGVLLSVFVTRLAKSLLFATRGSDPAVFGGITVLLAIMVFIASYIPAKRAASINPIDTLRVE